MTDLAAFHEGLRLVMLVGAAMEAATPEQRTDLEARVRPAVALYQATGDQEPTRAAVRAVMGDTWQPGPAWAAVAGAL